MGSIQILGELDQKLTCTKIYKKNLTQSNPNLLTELTHISTLTTLIIPFKSDD